MFGMTLPEDTVLPMTWLKYHEGLGTFCKLCTKYGKQPRSGSTVWTKEPCILLQSESITPHMNSHMYEDAEQAERPWQMTSVYGGIAA